MACGGAPQPVVLLVEDDPGDARPTTHACCQTPLTRRSGAASRRESLAFSVTSCSRLYPQRDAPEPPLGAPFPVCQDSANAAPNRVICGPPGGCKLAPSGRSAQAASARAVPWLACAHRRSAA